MILTPSQIKQVYNEGKPALPWPVHWWKLDEESGSLALDSGSNPYNGSLDVTYTPEIGQEGYKGKCYYFGGQANPGTIKCGTVSNTSIQGSDGIFGISLWFNKYKENTTSGYWHALIVRGLAQSDQKGDMCLLVGNYSQPGYIQMQIKHTSGWYSAYTDVNVDIYQRNKWHHLVLTADGVTAKTYMDGAEILTMSASAAAIDDSANTHELQLGNYPEHVLRSVWGWMQDVRVYKYHITPARVLDLYHSTEKHYSSTTPA